MNYKTVAEEIYNQFGGNHSKAMIGIYNTVYDSTNTSGNLSFRFKAKADKGINYIKIELTPMDDYTMTFGKIHGTDYKEIQKVNGVYCDMLKDVFEMNTGLYLD